MAREALEGEKLKILEQRDVGKIHHMLLKLLEEVGVKTPSIEALEFYKQGGAKVKSDSPILKIPFKMVEKALRDIPSKILLCGREELNDLVLEGRKVYYWSRGQN